MKHMVLLVDDEESVLKSLSRVLHGRYDIVTATNGHDGLSALQGNQACAVVIADQKMPGMDGVKFLAKVQEASPNTVRIMLSGNRDFEASIRAVNEGNVFRFLTKPFPAGSLIEILETAVEQYEMNREISSDAHLRTPTPSTLSVCSYCAKVRKEEKPPMDPASWERIELFFARHFGFRFSHCICPECVERLYAEIEEERHTVSDPLVIGSKEPQG
ncbi:MAG: response regulator [Candidatus Cloacimonetes bacterium]|nr:response regulator [Candidatus Cloacimonadota bacterium]